MLFCPKCGKEIGVNPDKCNSCGALFAPLQPPANPQPDLSGSEFSFKFNPNPGAITCIIIGIIGIISVINYANQPFNTFHFGGPPHGTCETCNLYTIILVASLIMLLGSIPGCFKLAGTETPAPPANRDAGDANLNHNDWQCKKCDFNNTAISGTCGNCGMGKTDWLCPKCGYVNPEINGTCTQCVINVSFL